MHARTQPKSGAKQAASAAAKASGGTAPAADPDAHQKRWQHQQSPANPPTQVTQNGGKSAGQLSMAGLDRPVAPGPFLHDMPPGFSVDVNACERSGACGTLTLQGDVQRDTQTESASLLDSCE
jgi:hypothetical protein